MEQPQITVCNLTISYGSYMVMHDVSFSVHKGDVFVVMGGSGSGKSSLLNCLIGLREPSMGDVLYGSESFTHAEPDTRLAISRRFGVLFQFGALWSWLTLAENVALPLMEYTPLSRSEILDLAELKLSLVGLSGFADFYPNQISGGMQKRAGLARAMALDPEILFFDEPSSGLDPVSARHLDDLILELKSSLGSTIVVISHDLASIFTIANDSIYLDAELKSVGGRGSPKELLEHSDNPRVRQFLTRGTDAEKRP